jgi:perosamine synthetase
VTLAPSTASFAKALALRPSAVVVAHWFGLPVPLAPLIEAAHGVAAVLIEDAAQGVGGSALGRPLGSTGDFGILSFGRGKGRTGGRGGALLANSPGAASRLQRAARHVTPSVSGKRGLVALAAQWAAGRPWLYALPSAIPSLRLGATVYHPPEPVREMPEWAAAVANAVWDLSALESTSRRRTAERWGELVGSFASLRTYAAHGGSEAGWLRYPVLSHDSAALLDGASRRLGIMPGYPGLLADLPLAPGRLVNAGPWPGAATLASQLRTLPSHNLLRDDDVAAIVRHLGRHDHRGP